MTTLDELARLVPDDARVGIGGALDRRRPLALCRAVAAAGRRGLQVWSFLAGPELDALGDAVAEVTTGYLDPQTAPRANRRADDGTLVVHESGELRFVGGLPAAASGLPFWPTLGGVGSDTSAGLRTVQCPYTQRPVLAVAATPLDVALLHAPRAARDGTVLRAREREFLDDADVVLARAAGAVLVTVDEWAPDDEVWGGRESALAGFEVTAIACLGET